MSLYFDQTPRARYFPSKHQGQDIRVGWGKGKSAVDVCLTPAQARKLIREIHDALQQAEKHAPLPTTSAFNRAIGENVRRERGVCRLTAEYVAKTAGLSKSFLSEVENGKRGISSENLVAIARAVGCTIEDLLRGTT